MTSYQPLLRCSNAHYQSPMNCDQILWSMPATKELHVFGHRDDPDVDIGLPYDLENGEVFPHEKHHDFDIQNYSLILLIA